ncbi:hypothetical protein SSX86_027464 [Deinandra increscens subsp. villosa]|uniref:Cysteine-rich receptor-like protein kinase 10 n=1 Tax=Deinandra increscens subsp. villosa TaxID=3103831 RepID=A0AAP0CGF8_9ASTR
MNFPTWTLFFLIFIGGIFHLTAAQGDFWGSYCGSDNYTKDSAYQKSLDDVLYLLTGTNNGFGFYNYTSGQAHAAALCRGDIEPETCRRCVDDATRRLRQVCPNEIEAGGWYDACFLRYSNRTVSKGLGYSLFNSYNVPDSSYDEWNQTVSELLGELRSEIVGGGQLRRYASGNKTAPGLLTVYGMMQCTPDLSATECDDCLAGATGEIQPYSRSFGVRFYETSCLIQYESYRFFNATWFPALPPSSPSSPSIPRLSSPSGTFAGKRKSINVGVIIAPISALVVAIIVAVVLVYRRRRKLNRKGSPLPEFQVGFSDVSTKTSMIEKEDEDTGEMNSFSLTAMQVATNNFSLENKLGQGGFGPVYKGKLEDGKEIAVKRLSRNSGQGLAEFKTEVKLIIKLQHKNLVRLLGYCVKGSERLLIYEFMANNSLDTFLFDANKCKELDWAKRSHIVIGIAKGLRYLHEDSRLKIIHRDMKASNILLDNEMNAKISDFGTARIFGRNQMEDATTRIVGTYGYMAPEYAMEGQFSTKSDIYSFGVLLLEIVCGQRNNRFIYQDQPQNLLSTAWSLWNENKGEQLIDHHLTGASAIEGALRWINIALLCVQDDPQDRPTMSTVVFMLEGQWSANLPTPSEPPLSFARFTSSVFEQTKTTSDLSAHPYVTSSTTASS